MKKIYLLLLLLIIVGCARFNSSELPIEDVDNISEVENIQNIVNDVEKTVEIPDDKKIVVREDGIEVALESIENKFIGNSGFIFYNFHSRDLVGRSQNALDWTAYLYVTKSDLVEIPLCTSEKISDTEWISKYCIEESVLESYGQDLKIIYTSRPYSDLRALSDFKIANLDDTVLFNFTKTL